MKVELELSSRTINKIRALNILIEGSSDNINDFLAKVLDRTVSDMIVERLDLGEPITSTRPVYKPQTVPQYDASEISDGLGDDDFEIGDEDAFVPDAGGLTDDDLEKDMSVEDPSTEAKSDAVTFGDEMKQGATSASDGGADLFAQMAGFGGVVDGDVRTVNNKRRPAPGRRGKVSTFSGHEESSI